MPTYNIALTTGAYPDLVGTSSNRASITAGDTITVNITMANASNFSGSLGVSLVNNPYAGTFNNQGTPNGTHSFSFTADTSWVGNTLNPMSFFAREDGAVIGTQAQGTLESGRIWWQVVAAPGQSHGSVTGVSAAGTASETPAITVSSSGTTGTVQVGYSKTSSATSSTYPISWVNHASSLTGPTRGGWDYSGNGVKDSTWYFWVRSSNYWATNQSVASGVAYTPPYLAADLSISITDDTLTSSDGTWTVNFTGGGSNENYAIANSDASTANPYYSSGTTKVDSGVGGSSIYNSNASNTPSGTTTYYIWGSRTKVSGGSGGQGWNTTGWAYTGQSFTVEMGVDETCDNPSGKWFDTTSSAVDPSNSDNALRTRANFSGLSADANKYYVVVRQDSGGSWETARAWWSGDTSKAVTFTDPLAALDTQRTYKLYSNSSQSLSGATDELSFTRTRITPEVLESPVSVDIGSTSYTVTLGDTDVGITYYIMDGSGTGANTLASGTATGDSLTLTVSSGLPGASAGSTTTVYVWALSPLNWYSTTAFATGESIVVTRVSQGSTGGSTTPANPGDYGMIVKNDAGNIVVDTTSRFGRIVGSGTLTASNGGYIEGTSPQVQVSGMDTSDNTGMTWHVVVTEVDHQFTSGWQLDMHFVTIGSGYFTITNSSYYSGNGHKYKYVIVRSR